MMFKLKLNKKNVSSPLSGGSHCKPWSCTRWHAAGRAIAFHHVHSHGTHSARTSCVLLRWSPWKPLMAGQRSYRHTFRTLCRQQSSVPLCSQHDVWSLYVCFLKQGAVFLLGICFLQQRDPELIFIFGLDRHQPIVDGWQVVVNDHIYPLSKPPELSKEGGGEVAEQVVKLTTGLIVLLSLGCSQITLPWS